MMNKRTSNGERKDALAGMGNGWRSGFLRCGGKRRKPFDFAQGRNDKGFGWVKEKPTTAKAKADPPPAAKDDN
jgi:hypothetical protein